MKLSLVWKKEWGNGRGLRIRAVRGPFVRSRFKKWRPLFTLFSYPRATVPGRGLRRPSRGPTRRVLYRPFWILFLRCSSFRRLFLKRRRSSLDSERFVLFRDDGKKEEKHKKRGALGLARLRRVLVVGAGARLDAGAAAARALAHSVALALACAAVRAPYQGSRGNRVARAFRGRRLDSELRRV